MSSILRSSALWRVAVALYVTACVGLLSFVSWSLLSPDPFAVVRQSSLAWVEELGDVLTHVAAFTAVSVAWLGLFPVLRREVPPPAIFAVLGYCLCMEALQAFVPGRDCNALDAIANVTGFVIGLSIVRLVSHRSLARQTGY